MRRFKVRKLFSIGTHSRFFNAIERDGFYVRVPAGKQFYLYITQTVDEDDAKIGGTLTASFHAADDASPTPSPALATTAVSHLSFHDVHAFDPFIPTDTP